MTVALVGRYEASAEGCRLLWSTVGERPVLFLADGRAALEMLAAREAGERPVALVEAWPTIAERLD